MNDPDSAEERAARERTLSMVTGMGLSVPEIVEGGLGQDPIRLAEGVPPPGTTVTRGRRTVTGHAHPEPPTSEGRP
jgi:hypothetical protein